VNNTTSDIQTVYAAETKFKLKPHLAAAQAASVKLERDSDGLLRVSLRELLSPAATAALKRLGLLA
jgi:hypothetical protein